MYVRYREASIGVAPDTGVLTSPDFSRRVTPLPPDEPERGPEQLPVVRLQSIEIHAITEKQCVEHILDALDHGIGGTVVTPNLDILRRCTHDLIFASLVSESDLVVPDGMPLIWASRLQGTPLPQRVAGSDLITTLSLAAAGRGKSIFLLGGAPGSAEGAAKILQTKAPHLKVAGMYCPPMGFEDKPDEMRRLIEALMTGKPDIVWVALGSPKQEFLVNRIRNVLPSAWWLGVGISFSFLTGDVVRAPKWVQSIGCEWIHRLVQEPKRLLRRYLVDGLPFALSLMYGCAINRFNGMQDEQTTAHRIRSRPARRLDEPPSMEMALSLDDDDEPATPGPDDSVHAATLEPPPPLIKLSDAPTLIRSGDSPLGKGLKRLKAVILLGGRVRRSPLSDSIGRSVLDLPLDETGTILNHWIRQSADLAERYGLENLQVRVMVDHKATEPQIFDPKWSHMVRVERDQSSFRGTGGLLADICRDYADDDLVLVGNATQVLMDPLWAIAAALDHKTGDFTLISHRDGTASGIMLLACKTLRTISDVGYIDLKEQALPKIAQSHDVRVVHCRQPTGLPLFSLADYISALQRHHRRRERRGARRNPLGETFGKHFAIVEPGAVVAPDAYLHDAVILRGAKVESNAAAVRSLVCASGAIARGQMVSDQLIGQC
ncbi:MAG TPA: WecB/TagA/CpsF family glycosyltransferase [Tepidisphaeraceae bacterium]